MKIFGVAAAVLALALPAAAARAPTLAAIPLVVGEASQVSLTGTAPKPGQRVLVLAKECDGDFFRLVGASRAGAAGGWSLVTGVSRTTAYRARVGRALSRPVLVHRRVAVSLSQREHTRLFIATVHGAWELVGKPIRLERYTDSGWVLVSKGTLRKRLIFGQANATFRIVRRGLLLRAFVPTATARPCFVAGASKTARS